MERKQDTDNFFYFLVKVMINLGEGYLLCRPDFRTGPTINLDKSLKLRGTRTSDFFNDAFYVFARQTLF